MCGTYSNVLLGHVPNLSDHASANSVAKLVNGRLGVQVSDVDLDEADRPSVREQKQRQVKQDRTVRFPAWFCIMPPGPMPASPPTSTPPSDGLPNPPKLPKPDCWKRKGELGMARPIAA